MERLKRIKPDVAVILLSSENSPEVIFSASKLGADDYLSKPFELKDLDLRINKILDKQRPAVGSRAAPRSGAAQSGFRRPVRHQSEDGRGQNTIEQVADTTATVSSAAKAAPARK